MANTISDHTPQRSVAIEFSTISKLLRMQAKLCESEFALKSNSEAFEAQHRAVEARGRLQ